VKKIEMEIGIIKTIVTKIENGDRNYQNHRDENIKMKIWKIETIIGDFKTIVKKIEMEIGIIKTIVTKIEMEIGIIKTIVTKIEMKIGIIKTIVITEEANLEEEEEITIIIEVVVQEELIFQKMIFDLFESTKQFEKDKEMAKIEQQVKEMKIEGNTYQNELEPEKAYNPDNFYDTLSCDTFEKINNKKINRKERNKLMEEQQRIDQETFGLNNYDNRRTNNYNNGFPPKRRYNNYSNGQQQNTYKNTPRNNQYTRQNYVPKQTQGKKFRPVNKETTEST